MAGEIALRLPFHLCKVAPSSLGVPLWRRGKPDIHPAPLERVLVGEVSEWSKEHAWKVCMSKGIEGSNPSLTAIFKKPGQ